MKITLTIDTQSKKDIGELLALATHLNSTLENIAEGAEADKTESKQHEAVTTVPASMPAPAVRRQPAPEHPTASRQPASRQPAPAAERSSTLRREMPRAEKSKEVPDGLYTATLHDAFTDTTKTGKSMVVFDFKITTGDYSGRHIFMRQVYSGTKNDARCVAAIESLINEMCIATDQAPFEWRDRTAETLESCIESNRDYGLVVDDAEMRIQYNSQAYQSVKIL